MIESKALSKFLLTSDMRIFGMGKNWLLELEPINLGLSIQKQVERKSEVGFKFVC